MNLGEMAIKGYPTFPELQHYWSLTNRLFCVISETLVMEVYPSAEMQSVYSTKRSQIEQCVPSKNRCLSVNSWWLINVNHVKFTEVSVM